MSKRARDDPELEQLFSTWGNKTGSASSTESGEVNVAARVASKKRNGHGLPYDRFAEDISRLITKFKTINSAVTTLQSRRKQCLWGTVVESYQSIAIDALTLDDLLTILSIWRGAFHLRWHVKSFDAHNNPRGYELVVEIPPRVTNDDDGAVEMSDAQSPPPSQNAQPAQESTSRLLMQRIAMYTDKVYALVDKAVATNASELGIHPDPSLLPEKQQFTPLEPTVHTEKSGIAMQAWEQEVLTNEDPLEAATYEVLAARAIERGRKASAKAELLKAQVSQEETSKLLVLLPAIADSLRSLSRRLNRSRMAKRECVESVAASMHIKHREALSGIDQLAAIVPDFVVLESAQDGMPTVAHINVAAKYSEVRRIIVEFVKNGGSV